MMHLHTQHSARCISHPVYLQGELDTFTTCTYYSTTFLSFYFLVILHVRCLLKALVMMTYDWRTGSVHGWMEGRGYHQVCK